MNRFTERKIRRFQSQGATTRARQPGFSLLEVVVGMLVVGLILVPTTAMMSDVMRGQTMQSNRIELLHLARGKQQEYAHLARVTFGDRQFAGTFAAEGHPQMHYTIACSQLSRDGGIPNRLLAIRTFAWYDANTNRQFDSNETSVDLWTSVARATP